MPRYTLIQRLERDPETPEGFLATQPAALDGARVCSRTAKAINNVNDFVWKTLDTASDDCWIDVEISSHDDVTDQVRSAWQGELRSSGMRVTSSKRI